MTSRSPPYSRKYRFIEEIQRFADDDSHGYSQKPPSGRWGPDYDCSSVIYQAAHNAGYSVGAGGDKVRFTGTMLKDFEKAGFQILPFANVGISDLEIGDILLNLALHAEVYVGDNDSIGATASEDGTYTGEAGDQTGHEIERHPVITFKKDWDYVLRPPNDDVQCEETEEGEDDMAMNYGQNPMNQSQGWPNGTNNNPQMYPQGGYGGYGGYNNYNRGYPQGNLGQMNGYSQAGNQYPSVGNQQGVGYPQGTMNELEFVMGIEGAKGLQGAPNSRRAVFDEDKPLMFIVHFGANGMCDEVRAFEFNECSEEMPQHLSPLMRQNMTPANPPQPMPAEDSLMSMTREELKQIVKEMMHDESSKSPNQSAQSGSNQQRNGSNGSNNRRSNN